MNPAIATLAEGYADRPREDRLAATRAYCDSDGVYRLTILKVSYLEAWVEAEWERQASIMSFQGWWYDDRWEKVPAWD